MSDTLTTSFYHQHQSQGARFVDFAGVQMPIQYDTGILKEHEWVRTRAGIFDVSHMGQALIKGEGAAAILSRLTPSDFSKIPVWKCKYTLLLNEQGGIEDDLIVTRLAEDTFHLVVNASRTEHDLNYIKNHLTKDTELAPFAPRTPLIALQGPYAEDILVEALSPRDDVRMLGFMMGLKTKLMGADVLITRTGYTGEDGFEISIQGDDTTAQHIWLALSDDENVKPIGLGARDSLRLEAGFPLYGNDLDTTTTPVEAGLGWVVSKKHTGYLGEEVIRQQLENGPPRKRIGIALSERGIAREGTKLFSADGHEIGTMTSGGFCPSIKQAIGQAYVTPEYGVPEKVVLAEVRNRRLRARTHRLNFIGQHKQNPGA